MHECNMAYYIIFDMKMYKAEIVCVSAFCYKIFIDF